MSPLDIRLLLHIYYSPVDPHKEFKEATQLVENTLTHFRIQNLIDSETVGDHEEHRLLPRGETLVQMLLDTPLPEQVWVDPRFSEDNRS